MPIFILFESLIISIVFPAIFVLLKGIIFSSSIVVYIFDASLEKFITNSFSKLNFTLTILLSNVSELEMISPLKIVKIFEAKLKEEGSTYSFVSVSSILVC